MSLAPDMLADRLTNVVGHAKLALVGGAVLTVGLLAAAFVWPHGVLRSYLFGYVFFLNLALGSLGWLTLGHVTGGAWGRSTRRYFEAMAGTLPLLAVLGLPLIVGASHLYAWADADALLHDPIIAHRAPWSTEGGVAVRAVLAFAAMIAFSQTLRRLSLKQDAASDPDSILTLGQRMRTLSQAGCCVLFVAVELLSVDFIMALEPHWISSIFGLLILCGQTTGAMALVILAVYDIERQSENKGLRPILTPDRVHDLGKLLMTSLILWAYMNFFQYLVQYMGDTQEDVKWYVHHLHGWWSWAAAGLCVFHLGVPLLLLLSKPLKRSLRSLAAVAGWIFVMRVVDILWTVAASGPHGSVGGVYVGDPVAFLGIGGLVIGLFYWNLSRVSIRTRAYLTSGANVTGVVVQTERRTHGV